MTNNTPDYEDNLYFDCKNCKYTDEYCASGDCNKTQANDLVCNKISLTEQWKKGELPQETECYVRVNSVIYLGSIRYKNGCHNKKLPYIKNFNGQFITKHVEEILAPVPSYDEWINFKKLYASLEEDRMELKEDLLQSTIDFNKMVCKNAQLKELLKECFEYIDWTDGTGSPISQQKLLDKIDEVLKCR